MPVPHSRRLALAAGLVFLLTLVSAVRAEDPGEALREAARLGDAGDDAALVALRESTVVATEAARSVTERALEVCGGQGYTRALPIERHLRDARAGAVMAPTNGVLRNWIGKALAGLPVP